MRTPPIPSFVDGKDNLDKYFLRFERYAGVAKSNRNTQSDSVEPAVNGQGDRSI